jgi:hypothetical protein
MDRAAFYRLTVLSNLMTHAGRIGPGRRHVVELMRMKDLEKLTFARFEQRLAESEKALAVIRRPTQLTPTATEPYAVSAL